MQGNGYLKVVKSSMASERRDHCSSMSMCNSEGEIEDVDRKTN